MKHLYMKWRQVIGTILTLTFLLTQLAFILPSRVDAPFSASGRTGKAKPPSQLTTTVELNEWYYHNWTIIFSPYACYPSDRCWANPDYHASSWLLSKQSVLIDPTWKKPALVYRSKHYSKRAINFCYVEVQTAGETKWDRIKTIGGTRNYWYKVIVDLKAYAGKKIQVKFFCEPQFGSLSDKGYSNIYNKQILYVDDVAIVADSSSP